MLLYKTQLNKQTWLINVFSILSDHTRSYEQVTQNGKTQASKVTTVTEVQSASARLPVHGAPCWVLLQRYYVAISFHCGVWYHALLLHYVCIQSSGIIFIP